MGQIQGNQTSLLNYTSIESRERTKFLNDMVRNKSLSNNEREHAELV